MKLQTVAKYLNTEATHFTSALLETHVKGFSIDSRHVQAGEVFFALSQPDYQNNCFNGDFADSHVYVPDAFRSGALAAVVRPDRYDEHKEILEPFLDRLLFVDDAILALQTLAKSVYLDWNKPVVGVTGSAGKTTAKTLIADVLSAKLRVLTNIKNYNNGLGLPLTVLRLVTEGEFDIAVLEMGMSTPNNEIRRLCRITPPDVSVVLNVLPVHIEHLGSIEAIQKAKGELVEEMKIGGTAILNADDTRVLEMSKLSKGDVISYGIENKADVFATEIKFERIGKTFFTLNLPSGTAKVLFPLNGKHNISNALAAAAVGYKFGMSAEEIAEILLNAKPPDQRGEILYFKDFTVVNDSYNSNPDALLSMVETLVNGGAGARRKVAVVGEMRELGDEAANIHENTGAKIAKIGIDALYGVEGFAKNLVEGARDNGLLDVEFYANSVVASEKFIKEVQAGDLILVKGSRGVQTEKVIEKLLENFKLEN